MSSVVAMERDIDLRSLILINESISWTPDLMISLKKDPSVIKRLMSGKKEYINSFFKGHKVKMENFRNYLENLDDNVLDKDLKIMFEGGISVITLFDDDYPPSLRSIPDPPLVIYHAGTLYDFSKCVAISGTRDPTRPVIEQTAELARTLAENGFTVTSGLALGIDTCAHEAALSVVGAPSIAVTASGLDRVVPRSNLSLAKRIASRGAVMSEKCLRPEPLRHDFIRRNRIISGISRIQIIMQSYGSGGTEQQFNIALEQGRPILVYDGNDLPIGSRKSAETMIRKGATGFGSIDEAIDLVDEAFREVISTAEGKDISLERWS